MDTVTPLLEIIQRLRGEKGCDWDKKQTPDTMWRCLAEETYELEEAIVKDDTDNIIEELGDVLFQILFIFEIYNEEGRFRFADVVDRVAQKMIRRHPHVYGDAKIDSEEALNRQWDEIKSREKAEAGTVRPVGTDTARPVSALDGVPRGMPGLVRALKVSKAAVKAGFEWESLDQVLDTAKSEIREFESALANESREEAMVEFGDILFSLVNVARFAGFHPETALHHSTAKFEGRFRTMEKNLTAERRDLKSMSAEEREARWQSAKQAYDK